MGTFFIGTHRGIFIIINKSWFLWWFLWGRTAGYSLLSISQANIPHLFIPLNGFFGGAK
jgi:hypothetical protein